MARGSHGDVMMAWVSRVRETRSIVERRTTKEWMGVGKGHIFLGMLDESRKVVMECGNVR